jgi:KRAB domain-containing zinc finger protein
MKVKNVGKLSNMGHTSLYIRELTPVKKPMSVLFVNNTSINSQISDDIREFTWVRNYECKECTKTFNHKSSFVIQQKRHTMENPCECNVCGKTICWKTTSTNICECMQVRNPMNVKDV